MNCLSKKIRSSVNFKEAIFSLKKIITVYFLFLLAFAVVKFPHTAANGVIKGIDMCLNTLIPTLFPFMVISSALINFSMTSKHNKLTEKIAGKLFKLPPETLTVIFLSMIGGFPVGAKLINDIYMRGCISCRQGRRMMLFCVNAGPAFIVGTVGGMMLGNEKAGWIIYISIILSSILIGVLSSVCFKKDHEAVFGSSIRQDRKGISESVKDSGKSMLTICLWVLLFSCITELISVMGLNDKIYMFVCCILEVTNGCRIASEKMNVYIVTSIIAFGGISTHFQLSMFTERLKMKYSMFLAGRILNSLLSGIICLIMLSVFPITKEIFSAGSLPDKSGTSVSVITSVFMIIMTLLFIIGDDYVLVRKKK